MFLILAIKESLALLIALVVGLLNLRKLTKAWKTLLLQVGMSLFSVFTAYIVTMYQRENNLPYNNQWVYNISILIEGSLLFYAAYIFLGQKINTLYLIILTLPFYFVYFIQLFFGSFSVFANYAYAILGISVTVLYSMLLYRVVIEDYIKSFRSPGLYMSLGIILYFACIVPYISFFSHLQKYFPYLSIKLFDYIVDLFSNLRYIFLALAFLLLRTKPEPPLHAEG